MDSQSEEDEGNIDGDESESVNGMSCDESENDQLEVAPFEQEKFRRLWAKMVLFDGLPFGLGDLLFFRVFIAMLNPPRKISENMSFVGTIYDVEDSAEDDYKGHALKKMKCELGISKFDQALSEYLLAMAIIGHEFPFSIVQSHTFRELVAHVQPLFRFVDSKAIKEKCMMVHKVEKLKLLLKLASLDCRINVACDVWSFESEYEICADYIVTTAHFVDKDWKLWRTILGFKLIDYGLIENSNQGAGEYISECIFKQLQSWNIHKKLLCFAMDDNFADDIQLRNFNMSYGNYGFVPDETIFHGGCCSQISNTISVRKLRALCGNEHLLDVSFFHVGCCSQVLKSIVRNVLIIGRSAVSKLRDCIHHVNFSAESKQSFALCVEKNQLPKLSILLDKPRRWDSTFEMLGTGIKLKSAFKMFAEANGDSCCFTSEEEWKDIETVYECLIPVYRLAEALSSARHHVPSLYFSMICELKIMITGWCNEGGLKHSIASKMVENFEYYWHHSGKVMAIVSFLDPRLKMMAIKYYYPIIYGEHGERKISDLHATLVELYDKFQLQDSIGESQKPVDKESSCTSAYLTTLLKGLDMHIAESPLKCGRETDLDLYTEEPLVLCEDGIAGGFDILSWWKTSSIRYPILAKFAREILAIPLMVEAPENVFIMGGRVMNQFKRYRRRSQDPHDKIVPKMLCAQNWIRNMCQDAPNLHRDAFISIDDPRGYNYEDDEGDEDEVEMEFEGQP